MLLGIFSYVISSITCLISDFDIHKLKPAKKMAFSMKSLGSSNSASSSTNKSPKPLYESSRSTGVELANLVIASQRRCSLLFVIHRMMIEDSSFLEGKPLFFVTEVSVLLRPPSTDINESLYKEDESLWRCT
jgi:hypothetical protein